MKTPKEKTPIDDKSYRLKLRIEGVFHELSMLEQLMQSDSFTRAAERDPELMQRAKRRCIKLKKLIEMIYRTIDDVPPITRR